VPPRRPRVAAGIAGGSPSTSVQCEAAKEVLVENHVSARLELQVTLDQVVLLKPAQALLDLPRSNRSHPFYRLELTQ
jgi:hypothetical protein